jgi:hypothetical protein
VDKELYITSPFRNQALDERQFSDLKFVEAADGIKGDIKSDEDEVCSNSISENDSSENLSPVSKLGRFKYY